MELRTAATVDDSPSIKFLCSFGGSILPRPLDGRLRYVGGETRIAMVPRKVSYEDLMARAREIYDGVLIIKYQQPDEDVDALVSVVNDDDVMNMIEEYDKLSSASNGGTWLRIFLFSQIPDHNHFEHDEWENERRYIDALNSLTNANSSSVSDFSELYSRNPSIDGGNYNHHNLQQLSIPLSPHGQRYGEMDASSSPVLFSPRQQYANDPSEFTLSPSSSRLHLDEYVRQTPGLQLHPYDHHIQPLVENLAWLPAGAIVQEQSGFPTNLGHSHNMTEGNNICEHCFTAFHKNHSFTSDSRVNDTHLKNGQPCMEQLNMVNEYAGSFPNSYVEGFGTRDPFMANQDLNIEHGIYVNEQNEQYHSFYNEYDRGWAAHNHHITHRLDNMRIHDNGTGRVNEHHIIDGSMVNVPFMHGNASNGHLLSSNYIGHDDTSYLRHGTNIGNEVYLPQQTVGGGTGTYEQGFKDTAIVYRNQPFPHGAESPYQVPNNSQPIQSLWRRRKVPIHPGTLYESPSLMMTNGGEAGFIRVVHEGSPRLPQGSPRLPQGHVEGQIPNALSGSNNTMSPRIVAFQDSVISGYPHQYGARQNSHNFGQEDSFSLAPVSSDAGVQHPPTMASDLALPMNAAADRNLTVDVQQREHEILEEPDQQIVLSPTRGQSFAFATDGSQLSEVEGDKSKLVDADSDVAQADGSQEKLNFLPELIASVQKAVIEGAEEVIATELDVSSPKEEPEDTNGDGHRDSEGNGDNEKLDKIEPTSAEAEALEKGLQTIKNDDLEEIRELGSGTFGSVYYGKWRGSDVAIKRIKASCFAGRPSERDRLIADFWKEALLMSSLHHPNVVSFYGVVRDGPDCSLATVTEYMVNGSLKQFLQKKDRTIDRRKRLIIAMDVAFGMEYLHGKNIVHFDLKCENLLVNMRDPHRPVCKIGDLGLSKVKQQTLVSGGLRGTLPWMAPELLSGKSNMVSDKIDVYSYGIVMWELLTGEEPYSGMHCASMIGGIVNNSIRPKSPSWCDPEWKSLMESCWSSDPPSRPSFSEISQKLRKMAAAINLK